MTRETAKNLVWMCAWFAYVAWVWHRTGLAVMGGFFAGVRASMASEPISQRRKRDAA